jgi:hypothetical protein
MFVQLLKSILEKNGSTTWCLLISSAIFLFANGVDAGVYQRTKDGKTLVWNNFPSDDDIAVWSGKRDADGYATGKGTLSWYKSEKAFQTGSFLPGKGSAMVAVISYSGTMVHGKLNGPVIGVDPDGKKMRLAFADGIKTRAREAQSERSSEQLHNQRVHTAAAAPAEGPVPSPAVKEPVKKNAAKEKKMEAQKENVAPGQNRVPAEATVPEEEPGAVESSAPDDSSAAVTNSEPLPKAQRSASSDQPTVELASIRSTPPPMAPSSPAPGTDSAVKDRIVADLKDETQTVLSQVGEATDHFRTADRLDSVAKLPVPVSENVNSLVQRARDFRATIGYETALRDYRSETETVDALAAIDQATRNIAANDVLTAKAKLTDFLKSSPEPSAESQKPLWQYLASMQQLCRRLDKDASVHLQRAESFAAANRTTDAIREYQEAYRIFPNPATAEKIRQLQASSLGL